MFDLEHFALRDMTVLGSALRRSGEGARSMEQVACRVVLLSVSIEGRILFANRRKEGTGLGLNIARAIVERHGGTIGVVSAPGRGSRFHFDLVERHTAGDSENPR